MRWATFQIPPAATERIGVVRGNEIYAVAAGTRLIDLLGDDGERLAAAGAEALASPAEVVRVDRVRLLPPIPRPPAVRDFMTFRQHIEVIRKAQGLELPKQFFELPVFYFTNPHALVGAHDPVPMPPGCQNLDFECEIGVVIGRDGENLDPKNAADHVVGYCLFNDWSARDVQRNEMEMRLGPAKGKDTATTLGPWLVTKDELEPWRRPRGYDLQMVVSVNGREYGRDRWSNAFWSIGEIIAYASRGTKVCAGDVLGTGTCGNGCLAELRTGDAAAYPWLAVGDEIVYEVEQLGRIANRIVAGPPLIPLRP
jgi:2-keto-4-pentenoate hydratase/2-oxohepta-3-ene-1,7-dioic acid hydratase in catechol pathway